MEVVVSDTIREDVERYIRINDDKTVHAVIVYSVEDNAEDGGTVIRGAYYGYCGGGVNDGGYFIIDQENEDIRPLTYDDIDAIESENSALSQTYNGLMQEVWKVISDEDGELQLTAIGAKLTSQSDDDEVYMSDSFDGDALDEISKVWQLATSFDS